MRGCLLAAILLLTGCGAGGVAPAGPFRPMVPTSMQYLGVLRYQPTSLRESLASPAMQYVYVDSASSNGYYPDSQTFMSNFSQANPGLLDGACSAVAKLSDAVIEQTVSNGSSAPTVVIAAYPIAPGSCSQSVNLGTRGTATFGITVTP